MKDRFDLNEARPARPVRADAAPPLFEPQLGRALFVAEVSSNHDQDLGRALALVDAAADAGCDAVKFQLFRVSQLFAPEILATSPQHRARERWELPVAFLAPLAERAHARGLRFGCTPFDLDAVEELAPHVDFYKISSYEILWEALLEAVAARGRPLVLSTGMASFDEAAAAVDVVARAGCRSLVLLHCVSAYPTPAGQANLQAIATLRALAARAPWLRLWTGWSDHSVEPGVIHRAIHRHDAALVEVHIDLDGRGAEAGSRHCWLPGPLGELIRQVRAGEAADGSGEKRPAACELADRDWRADPADGLRPLRRLRRAALP
jgi:N-acetylneuraminate synthase